MDVSFSVFYETIKRLAAVVTPNHRDLRIPPVSLFGFMDGDDEHGAWTSGSYGLFPFQEYHAECPWPSAQAEIAIINAYKVSYIASCVSPISDPSISDSSRQSRLRASLLPNYRQPFAFGPSRWSTSSR